MRLFPFLYHHIIIIVCSESICERVFTKTGKTFKKLKKRYAGSINLTNTEKNTGKYDLSLCPVL